MRILIIITVIVLVRFSDLKGQDMNWQYGATYKAWNCYKREYKEGRRDARFLLAYIRERKNATGLPTPYKLILEYVNAVPKEKRFNDADVRALIMKYAAIGNELYQMLKENNSHFPELDQQARQIKLFSNMLLKVRYGSQDIVGVAVEMLKKDFNDQALEGIEFYHIINGQKSDKFLNEYFDFIDRNDLPTDFYPMILYYLIKQKDLSRAYAKRGLEFLSDNYELSTPGYFNYGAYAYFMMRTGCKSAAREFARQYIAMPWDEVQSKRSTWGFNTLHAIANGKEPEPFLF